MFKRFVIHIHSGFGQEHYDLMLEQGPDQPLATWQLSSSPVLLGAGGAMPARRIQDHRQAYLDYQGPVSGGRGNVRFLDRGRYELISAEAGQWSLRLNGTLLDGRYELVRIDQQGDQWTLRRI
jgi:hypothetical protein